MKASKPCLLPWCIALAVKAHRLCATHQLDAERAGARSLKPQQVVLKNGGVRVYYLTTADEVGESYYDVKWTRPALLDPGEIMLDQPVDCDACAGTGDCELCDGSGEHECSEDRCSQTHECGECKGSGDCEECGGTGSKSIILDRHNMSERMQALKRWHDVQQAGQGMLPTGAVH